MTNQKTRELNMQLEEEAQFSIQDLENAREAYLAEQEKDVPSPQVKFKYAWVLTKNPKTDNKYRGIGLLEDLIDEGYNPSDCLYFIALAYYSTGEYHISRQYCERLIRRDPTHSKAIALHDCIKEIVAKDGVVGIGIAATAAVVLGVGIKLLLNKRH